ncbi:MAG: hypothetical protein ACTHJM_13920 [Marmoricola sp.]
MGFLSGNNNVVLVNSCNGLDNLSVVLTVTEDMVTVGDVGFGMQLNCFPQAGQVDQTEPLNWFQYFLVVQNGQIQWGLPEYWDTNNFNGATGGANPWPAGYTPNPPGTTTDLPVIPNDGGASNLAGVANNRILAGSVLEIALTTDANHKVTKVTYSYTDPGGHASTHEYDFPNGSQFSIYGAQCVVVGTFNGAPTSFSSGAGTFSYAVSSGSLAVESPGTPCGGYPEPGTAENSNAIYGAITGTGATVTQDFDVVPTTMSFAFEQETFGRAEAAGTPSWNPAYYMQVTGFPNSALGLNSSGDLNRSSLSPVPRITASIDATLNPGLTSAQISTIRANLPSVNQLTLPVLAIDSTLATNFQTLMYPYGISFANLAAFDALHAGQVAVVTLTAQLDVNVPTGGNSNTGSITTTPVHLTAVAAIELAPGEDPRMENLNPASPLSYPSWLSYDLRIFTVTAGQSHDMFSVPSPANAGQAVPYIRQVLEHLNNPSLITNSDTFENALSQDENASAIPWAAAQGSDPQRFAFAVARVRIRSGVSEDVGPVRVFFRLFSAASTVIDFAEVGTGEGAYRWGSNGTPGHKIPLLGVASYPPFVSEYLTVPCFASDRVNLNAPADMKTQTDPPNVKTITTTAGAEVDTYFGCWLDVNQTSRFLIPSPPANPGDWDGPWTGTESLHGAIAVAPHQCLVAEIRFDDTPIPHGAQAATTDKLAQRNIAWLGVQP